MSFGLLALVGRTWTVVILLAMIAFFLVNREGVLYRVGSLRHREGGRVLRHFMTQLRPTHHIEVVRLFWREAYRITLLRVRKFGFTCHG